jgi:hypothetical protein
VNKKVAVVTVAEAEEAARVADLPRMSRSAWNFGDGPKVLSYAATSFFAV